MDVAENVEVYGEVSFITVDGLFRRERLRPEGWRDLPLLILTNHYQGSFGSLFLDAL